MKTVYEVLQEMLGEEQGAFVLGLPDNRETHRQRMNALETTIQHLPIEAAEKKV